MGVRSLLGRLIQWRISFKWLAIALSLALVMRLVISLIALLLGYISTIALRQATLVELVALFVMFFVAAMLEEIGWRGYALPRLLEDHSPLYAALFIGVFWGILHLALHLPGMPNEGLAGALTVLQLIGLSVLITWIFIHGRYNIILAGIFHAAQTFFVIVNEGVTLEEGHWLMAAVWCAAALIVIVADKAMLGSARRVPAASPQ